MLRLGLFGFERRLARVIFETILPPSEVQGAASFRQPVPVDAYLTDLFRTAPAQVCVAFRLLLWVVALAPAPCIGRMTTFGRLSSGERLSVLKTLLSHRSHLLREIPLFFKAFACFCLLSAPETQRRLGVSPYDQKAPRWARQDETP